jgi:hypothetical protein
MSKNKKPQLKFFLSKDAFNTFFAMLTFYVASEAQAGETFYSRSAAVFINQFVNYGNFIEKRNDRDDLFMIYLYENEIMRIMRMYNKYISVHQSPSKDYYTEFK